MEYNLLALLQDVANNAAADRAGAWLRLAADDYPWLFASITANLDAAPQAVVAAITQQNMLIGMMLKSVEQDQLFAFIGRLQQWFKDNQ